MVKDEEILKELNCIINRVTDSVTLCHDTLFQVQKESSFFGFIKRYILFIPKKSDKLKISIREDLLKLYVYLKKDKNIFNMKLHSKESISYFESYLYLHNQVLELVRDLFFYNLKQNNKYRMFTVYRELEKMHEVLTKKVQKTQ